MREIMLAISPYANDWLSQFNFEDRSVARRLLNNIKYVTTERFVSEVETLLVEILDYSSCVALYPVRELIFDDESYYPDCLSHIEEYLSVQGIAKDSKSLNMMKEKVSRRSVSDADFYCFNPILMNPIENPGSEAIVANLITQLTRRYKSRVLVGGRGKAPSLKDLREKKCRTVVFVDDVVGSGQRLFDFIKCFVRNKTINSWVSGGFLRLVAVSFMKSPGSTSILSSIKQPVEFLSVHEFPTFHDLDELDLLELSSLINKYSHNRERSPFGYDDTFGSAIFEHSVPNNTPAILWRNVVKWRPNGSGVLHSGSWRALFPNRSVPDEIKQSFRRDLIAPARNRSRLKLVLRICRDAPSTNTVRQISRSLKLDLAVVKNLVYRLKSNGLLDEKNKITASGLNELDYLETINEDIEFNSENYYPLSLHG